MKTYGYSVWIDKRGKVEKVAMDYIGTKNGKETAYFENTSKSISKWHHCLVYTLPCKEPNDCYDVKLAIQQADDLRKKILKCGKWAQTEYLRCYFNYWG